MMRFYEHRDEDVMFDACMKYMPEITRFNNFIIEPTMLRALLRGCVTHTGPHVIRVMEDGAGNVVGGYAAYRVDMLISKGKHVNDMFIFILPEHRNVQNGITLIADYKKWAREQIVGHPNSMIEIGMATRHKSQGMDKLFRVCGFEPCNIRYQLV